MILSNNNKYIIINENPIDSKRFILNNYKVFKLFLIFALFLFLFCCTNNNENINKIIEENFFLIDSNNLENISPHMYGYSISMNGILTDNYYKQLGEYLEPEPLGIYVMIRKSENKIIINQDFYGGFGLYLFENKDDNYFALSNSFLLLVEHLISRQSISFNKEYADNLITTKLCSFSLGETLIKEIKQIPANTYIEINIGNKSIKINTIDYEENTILLESEKGLDLLDKWVDKWGYIIRSLKKQTDNISFDLSGGFDTRTLWAVLLNSGINMNQILIHSNTDKLHHHEEDFNIATNISTKFGFKLNNFNLDNNSISLNLEDIIINTLYVKLGFHKEFYFKNKFSIKPKFFVKGSNGEALRGAPGIPINEFIDSLSSQNIKGHSEEFYNSSAKLLNRSINLLKNNKNYNNDYEISHDLYYKVLGRNHFGKSALLGFISNFYSILPLMDPDIKKIKFEIKTNSSDDLISYIYVRFAPDLINFPFQGNRTLDLESLKKAEKINKQRKPYKKKDNYNDNFFIDTKRIYSSFPSSKKENPYDFLYKFIKTTKYQQLIKKIYDINVYNSANKYIDEIKYHSLAQHYALLAISKIIDYLSKKESNILKFFDLT